MFYLTAGQFSPRVGLLTRPQAPSFPSRPEHWSPRFTDGSQWPKGHLRCQPHREEVSGPAGTLVPCLDSQHRLPCLRGSGAVSVALALAFLAHTGLRCGSTSKARRQQVHATVENYTARLLGVGLLARILFPFNMSISVLLSDPIEVSYLNLQCDAPQN